MRPKAAKKIFSPIFWDLSRFFHHRPKFGIKIGKIGRKTASFSSILPHTPFIFLEFKGYWKFPIFRDKNRAVLAVCPNSGQNPDFRDKGRLWPKSTRIKKLQKSTLEVQKPICTGENQFGIVRSEPIWTAKFFGIHSICIYISWNFLR